MVRVGGPRHNMGLSGALCMCHCYPALQFLYAVPKPNETTPTVLVVGATGETGRQVVRKLVLKGESLVRAGGGRGGCGGGVAAAGG